jgi:hypothetical protein
MVTLDISQCCKALVVMLIALPWCNAPMGTVVRQLTEADRGSGPGTGPRAVLCFASRCPSVKALAT